MCFTLSQLGISEDVSLVVSPTCYYRFGCLHVCVTDLTFNNEHVLQRCPLS